MFSSQQWGRFSKNNVSTNFNLLSSLFFTRHLIAIVTHPPVVLTSEMVAVCTDAVPPLDDVNRQLLNFIEVYEQNGSGLVISHFVSLQLTLWHLDPLRASAFVTIPAWIQTRKTFINVRGTGNDCFKWAVLAGMHPVDEHVDRMNQYIEHISEYDFSPLHFPVSLSSVGSFATANYMSINVYDVDDDKKVIYPIASHRHSFQVDILICYCSNVIVYTIIPPLGTLAD